MNKSLEIEREIDFTEILGVPKKGVIFSDLDGVWLDEDNNFASSPSYDLDILQKAQDAGYWLVLVSDTGSSRLASFAAELSFDPVVVAENGAVIYIPAQNLKQYLSPLKLFFNSYRQAVIKKLIGQNPKASIFIGDATELVRSGNPFPFLNSTAYLINSARECSFGVYTRSIDSSGNLLIDDAKTQETERLLITLLDDELDMTGLVCRRYPSLGSCLVKDPSIVKWKAIQRIIKQLPSNLKYYMIGDTINDSMEQISNRVATCAVGNASAQLKTVAAASGGIVAPDDLTIAKGANYIIRKILQK